MVLQIPPGIIPKQQARSKAWTSLLPNCLPSPHHEIVSGAILLENTSIISWSIFLLWFLNFKLCLLFSQVSLKCYVLYCCLGLWVFSFYSSSQYTQVLLKNNCIKFKFFSLNQHFQIQWSMWKMISRTISAPSL